MFHILIESGYRISIPDESLGSDPKILYIRSLPAAEIAQ